MNTRKLYISFALILGLLSLVGALTLLGAWGNGPQVVYAQGGPCVAGPHSGVLTGTQSWCLADSPHLLSGDVTVPASTTLTIEPGVIVQGNAGVRLQVYGHLDALGTVTQPITLTASSGAPGGWEGLYFYGSGTNQGSGHLRHATVQYGGGASTYANIYADSVQGGYRVLIESSRVLSASYNGNTDYGLRARSSNVVVSDTLFAGNGDATSDYALYATGGSAITVTGSTFQNNAGYAARVEPDGPFAMSGNTFSGNGYDRVLLEGSTTFAGDNTLPAQTGLEGYELADDVTVPASTTLTVGAGATVLGRALARLQVYGHLDALGTVTQPITFTASSGAPGGWEGLYFYGYGTNQGSGHLRHVTVQYGGKDSTYANIYADGVQDGYRVLIESSRVVSASYNSHADYGLRARTSNVVVSDTLFAGNGDATDDDYALYAAYDSAVTVTHSTFQNNAGYAARVEPDGPFALSGNTFSGNGYDRVLLEGSTFAGDNSLPAQTGLEGYELENDVTVPTSATLTVGAGATVLGRAPARLWVDGYLDALGTVTQPITFTSSSGAPGGWEGLYFYGYGTDQGSGHLRHVTVQYGGGASTYANIYADGVQDGYRVLIESSRVVSASYNGHADYGLRARGSNVVVSDTLFVGNGDTADDYGLYATIGSTITVTGSTFQNNAGYGLYVNNSQANLTCSTVFTNGNDGIYLTGSSGFWTLSSGLYDNAGYGLNNATGSAVDATYNWWGAVDGPGGVGPGSGDEVSSDVLYDPWLPRQECACDLLAVKSDAPDPVFAGSPLAYTLVVTNTGPGEATAVVVTDTLPLSMTFASAAVSQGAGCGAAGNVVTCTLGTLGVGRQATVTLTVDVHPLARGPYTNTATAAAYQTDHVPANNTSTATTTALGEADLLISKSDTPDPVIAGEALTYTLTITNAGPTGALGVTVTDTLPAAATFGAAAPSQGSCSQAGGVVVCDLGALVDGYTATITITTTINPAARGTITNTVDVAGDDPDPDAGNNTVTENTQVNAQADLALTKSDAPDPVIAGTLLTYTLTITNNGPSQATGVTLSDTLPAETAFVSATPGQGSCSQAGGVVTCSVGSLDPGAAAAVIVVSAVDPATRGTITNPASVTGAEPDLAPASNATTQSTTVDARADLAVVVSDTPDPLEIERTNILTYTLTITNDGPSQATGVALTNTLPAVAAFGSATSSQGSCSAASGIVTCDLGSLTSGDTETVVIVVTVDPTTTGTFSNTAEVQGVEPDPNPANSTTTESTTIRLYIYVPLVLRNFAP